MQFHIERLRRNVLERKAFGRKLLGILAEAFVRIERFVRPASIPDLDALQNILILEYIVPLGNCVHMTPLFEVIKRARPETKVTVATWGIGAQVLRNSPFVNDLLDNPRSAEGFLRGRLLAQTTAQSPWVEAGLLSHRHRRSEDEDRLSSPPWSAADGVEG